MVLKHPNEKTTYIAGGTVWYEEVEDNLKKYHPDVVVLNCGDAKVIGEESIIMGKQDVYEVNNTAPNATIIANPMESLNHAAIQKRTTQILSEKGLTQRVLVPEDGEAYSL